MKTIRKIIKSIYLAGAGIIVFYLFLSIPFFALLNWIMGTNYSPFESNPVSARLISVLFVIFAILFYGREF